MVSRIALNISTHDASNYKVDIADNVKVETRRIQVSTSMIKLETKKYRVVVIKNVSQSNVYVSTDLIQHITIEPGGTIGIGLEVVEIGNDIYLWSDSIATVEVLMIK